MSWTDERVENLKKLWAEGLSASQIAVQLGGVSRNAVIGKVHRLKLSSRGRSPAPASQAKRSPAPRPKAAPSAPRINPAAAQSNRAVALSTGGSLKDDYVAEPIAESDLRQETNIVVPAAKRLSLLELTESTCKWPVGDPLDADFHFCGHNSREASPYCEAHSSLAFQVPHDRRRR